MTVRTIEQNIQSLGRGAEAESVIIGSNAVKLALPGFREPHDIDIAVSPALFAHLQQQPEWEQTVNGCLSRDGMDVGTGWGAKMDFTDLQARSWRTNSGLHVAGLPDVYAYKQRRELPSDVQDMASIRNHLHGLESTPLAAESIPHEIAAARDCLPEALRDDPDAAAAILLAAQGLHTVYTLYGHPDIGQTNQIVGDLERPEFQVPATYHNGFGLISDLRSLQRHLTNIGAPKEDHFLGLAAEASADAVYGNGRFKNNPRGYDELRSADLLRARALQLGMPKDAAQRLHTVVRKTRFDEATGSQEGTRDADPLVRAVVGVDLQSLTNPECVEDVLALAIEDGCSARYSKARTIGRVLNEHGERVFSIDEGLELIDRYAHARPANAPGGQTVMDTFTTRLFGNVIFQRNYRYPVGYTLDNLTLRHTHADMTESLARRLTAGEITAVEAGRLAARYTLSVR